ncbi:U-box domain-containing protein 3 [Raphanus sativus]|uniref:RING-type E3 ubiquitin transferase n=1 Tax=Raphanus sativus TaxID=3726 RepID=A0A6J0NE79_RAPSA|nr:U-box domain-containing protein 3 [Raphanus sativus]XP_056865173.1 U-box domain-containing protein 3 [Raphanus sativus]KAJ4904669.1 U-box domain-containing protein 3 [Raphanus sativus]
MDPVPVRCLLNSISRYLHLVACQTIRYKPIQTCVGNVVHLLKLVKPFLDDVVDCKVPPDDCLNSACEDLDSVVNQAREFLEDWSPKMSKLFGVFHSELLLEKVQTCSLEISRILLQLSQSSPVTSSVQGVERCMQEIECFKQERTLSEHMKDTVPLDTEDLDSIIQMMGLISNQDLLKESIAVEKERIRSQTSKSIEKMDRLIDLVSCIREHMLKTEFLEVAKGISIPPYFRCPLSTELMLDPVIVASGQTFDRTSIKKWLDNGLDVCPRTRQVLTHQELIPNYTVKAMIASWLETNSINLPANCDGGGGDASSMANNMGSNDFNRTESFRFSLRSSSFTSRSSLETGNGFEKLKINVPASLCGESQCKDLENFELSSSGQSYTHSRSESVCSVVSSVDYVPSVTNETQSIQENHQSYSEMSPKKHSESSSNVNHEYDSGTMMTSHTIKLVQDLKDGSSQEKTAAAAEIRHLTINNVENRVHIGRCGAITPLLSLLYSEEELTQEHAVTALLNLSISEVNKAMIAEAGAIEPLVHVLNTGNDRAKENSAATLFSLSVLQINRERIGQSNAAIQALVNLLGKGTFRGKKDAASALFNLSITHENKARIVQAKAVKYLVELLNPDLEMVDKAVALLANLSAVGEGRQAIVREGGIPLLVETVDSGSQRGKENAASVLLQLCLNSPKFCTLVLQEGAIPPLVALSQSGTQRAKEKAQQLLSHFRNQRDARMKKGRP